MLEIAPLFSFPAKIFGEARKGSYIHGIIIKIKVMIVLFDPPKTVLEAVEMNTKGIISDELMWKYILKLDPKWDKFI